MNQDIPLKSELEMAIVMHRDAHFGGSFPVMLDYYLKQGKGIRPEFDFQMIEALAALEKEMESNLALSLLSEGEREAVDDARKSYLTLRKVYEQNSTLDKSPRLIADLILSEDIDAKEEVAAIVKEGVRLVPALIELLRVPTYYDPLFPGYGQAPFLAAKCLGLIGDKRAIISLFEGVGNGDFFDEDVMIQALGMIGAPAKTFLLTVLHGKPYNEDNVKAAICLFPFRMDPEVAHACLTLLKEPEVIKNLPFATYLILCCEGLEKPEDRGHFASLANQKGFDRALRQDILTISKEWNLPKPA